MTSGNGGITATTSAVAGAVTYVWHLTPSGKTGPTNATIMFATDTPSLSIPADPESRVAGDKVYLYVQAYPETGEGADSTAQAEWLNEHGSGSSWSAGVGVTIA